MQLKDECAQKKAKGGLMTVNYNFGREPLAGTVFAELPLGAVKPEGWLKDQLRIQARGFTGRLPAFWDYLGDNSGWLGGTGESWERGPYYLDGLLPLAYLLDDEELIKRAEKWIEWTLNSQREDGQFGPAVNDDWWCRMVMMKAIIQYEEATGDDRVIPFLLKYFKYQSDKIDTFPLNEWGKARGGENILVLQWLYGRTGEKCLFDLIYKIHGQTIDWTGIFNSFPYWRYQTAFDHRIHVVNVAMALKEPALFYLVSKAAMHKDASRKGIDSLMTYHGQLNGMFSGDEWLAGTHPSQGTELCAVVEYMFTLENLFRIYGEGIYGDILERVAFNALPATISPDWTSHQYVQQVNQIKCSAERRNWTENRDDANIFGLEPNFGCCTANMHQGWPKYAARLWMATDDRGLAAVSYAPCKVHASVADGVDADITVDTAYPFRDKVIIRINLSRDTKFPLKLRLPKWCKKPAILVNREIVEYRVEHDIASIERIWNNGDLLELTLPMEAYIEHRGNNAVGVFRGPLLFALPLEEKWIRRSGNLPFANYEVFRKNSSNWNFALQLDTEKPENSFEVSEEPIAVQPFSSGNAPVKLKSAARRVPQWTEEMNSAGTPPISPVISEEPIEDITLVLYGSARLRVAEFPFTEKK